MLYNDYRPRYFDEVIGQPSAVVLENFARNAADPERSSKLPHSLLITGTRGVGKTTLARLFAAGLNCKQIGDKFPCGRCPSCKRAANGRQHPDIIEIDTAVSGSAAGVQSLIEQMQLLPTYRRKVFIFDEAHTMSKTAMGMLLKTVEEPSRRTVVILLTTEPDRIDSALRSRCTWLSLRHLARIDIVRLLIKVCKAEDMRITKNALLRLAQYSNGSGRDALSILETMRGYDEVTAEMVEEVVGHRADVSELVRQLNERNVAAALKEVNRLCLLHEPLVIADSTTKALIGQMRAKVDKEQPVPHLIKWIEAFSRCKADRSLSIPQLSLELAVTECAMAAEFIPPPAIMMNDVEAFAAYAAGKQPKLAQWIKKLEFVRIKKDIVVLFRTKLRHMPESTEDAIERTMQKYLRHPELRLEVLYAD